MVKIKYIMVAVLVVVIGTLAAVYFFESEEKKVRKRFDLLSELVSKDPGENAFTMAHKIQSIRKLFADRCGLKTHIKSLSGTFTPEEISGYAARARTQFSKLSLEFYDLDIEFPEAGIGKVVLTAKLTGKSTTGEYFDEAHELDCVLKKIEDEWLFSVLEVVEVLNK